MKNDRKVIIIVLMVCVLGLALVAAPIILLIRMASTGTLFSRHAFAGQVTIPSGPGAYSELNMRQDREKYFRRTMVEAYRQVGKRNAKWDAAAEKFLEHCAHYSALQQRDDIIETALIREGALLVRTGCTDPMVLYNYGLTLFKQRKVKAAIPYLERAVAGLKACHYPRGRAWFAAKRLAEAYNDDTGTTIMQLHQPDSAGTQAERLRIRDAGRKKTDASTALAKQWLLASLRDGSYTSADRQVFFEQIDGTIGELLTLKDVLNALKQQPNADPYLVAVYEARDEIAQAWKSRGDGFANTVTTEGWKGFAKHLDKAHKLLTDAWTQHPELPQAPTEMITVAMAGHAAPGETVYTWFNRAMTAQMDYTQAYGALLPALRPRWNGSYEEIYAVGVASLDTKRFDTETPRQFLLALRIITDDQQGNLQCWQKAETYPRLKTLFEGYLHAVPYSERDQVKSEYAACAWMCGQYDDAERLLNELGPRVSDRSFAAYTNAYPSMARKQIRNHQPPVLPAPDMNQR